MPIYINHHRPQKKKKNYKNHHQPPKPPPPKKPPHHHASTTAAACYVLIIWISIRFISVYDIQPKSQCKTHHRIDNDMWDARYNLDTRSPQWHSLTTYILNNIIYVCNIFSIYLQSRFFYTCFIPSPFSTTLFVYACVFVRVCLCAYRVFVSNQYINI